MSSRILKINYLSVAEHLCEKLEQAQDPDVPHHQLSFECVRGILSSLLERYELELHSPFKVSETISDYNDQQHLTEQYRAVSLDNSYPESIQLTNILFEDLGRDQFEGVAISKDPGVVVWAKGVPIMLPLVLISVS